LDWDAGVDPRGEGRAEVQGIYPAADLREAVCDVFDDELNASPRKLARVRRLSSSSRQTKTRAVLPPLERRNPDDPVWSIIRKLADKIGEQLTTLLRDIAMRILCSRESSTASTSTLPHTAA